MHVLENVFVIFHFLKTHIQRGVENQQLGMRSHIRGPPPLGRFWFKFALFLVFGSVLFSMRNREILSGIVFIAFGTILITFLGIW